MESALAAARLAGVETNLDYLRQVISEPEFRAGGYPTSFLSRVHYHPRAFEVMESGMQTTVQDYPGRTGFWRVGVPPSGPMDTLALPLRDQPLRTVLREFALCPPRAGFVEPTRASCIAIAPAIIADVRKVNKARAS
jgi:hypothetical protein